MTRTTKISLYIAFALVALVFFLYIRFPSDLVKNTLTETVRKIHPDAELTTEMISPTFPPGLKLEPLFVNFQDQPVFRMDDFKVIPNLFSMFSSAKNATYRGNIGSGMVNGRADLAMQNNRQQTKVATTLVRIPIKYIDILNQWKSYQPDGELDATINYDSLKGGGTADVSLEISPARISFEPSLMGIDALDFSQIKAQLIVTRRMLQIRNCDAVGDQVQGKITGSIVFRDPIEDSRLTLSMTVKPQPAFIEDHKNDLIGGMLATGNAKKRGIVLRISGTINNPRYVIR